MKLTFISNSSFYCRFESRGRAIWLVWGNPNQKICNEALVRDEALRRLREWLNSHFDGLN
jgi:hypothetical protein